MKKIYLMMLVLIFSIVLAQERKPNISKRAQDLIDHSWTSNSFVEAISIMNDENETQDSRRVALSVMHNERLKLKNDEMIVLLEDVIKLMKDPSIDADFKAQSIHTMGNLALTFKELGVIDNSKAVEEGGYLLKISSDKNIDLKIRTQAIKVLGLLNIPGSIDLLTKLLSTEMNIPEIARPACLSLVRIDTVTVVPILKNVIEVTTDPDIFGTAAYSLGQIKTAESMSILVENAEKYRDVSSCGNALSKMETVIIDILKDHQHKYLSSAIKATLYLWGKEQREAYYPILIDLLKTAVIENKKLALGRLIEDASHKEFSIEKKDLAEIYEIIKDDPDLTKTAEIIKKRMNASLLMPVDKTIPVPAQTVGGVK